MSDVVSRARRLALHFASNPVLPALGWTKVVESTVAGGSLSAWIVYAVLITIIWVGGVRLDDAVDVLEDVVDDQEGSR